MQEFVVAELRTLLLLPLDDLLVVAREFVCPDLSRPALDRCLRRHGVARRAGLLPEVEGKPPLPKTFSIISISPRRISGMLPPSPSSRSITGPNPFSFKKNLSIIRDPTANNFDDYAVSA